MPPGNRCDDSDPNSAPISSERAELDQLRLEHAAVVRALQEAIRDTTRLTRLFAVLSESMPVNKLLDRVLATLSELFLADIVELLDATKRSGLVPLAALGLPVGSSGPSAHPAGGAHAQAALTRGQPIVVENAGTDLDVEVELRELGVETAVWLPVAGDEGSPQGVLMLARCRPLAFARADVELLTAIAYRIGLVVERAHAEQVRRMFEAKLRQAEKTESLGRMAAAIAHHFNNMLAAVVTSLDLALEELPGDHVTRDDLIRAREATLGAAKTAELMLAYLGQSTAERELVDLVTLTRSALDEFARSMPQRIRILEALEASALTVLANPVQLIQLLRHLVTNAEEAIGARDGQIRISVRVVQSGQIGDTYPGLDPPQPPGAAYACVEVSDTGCGMSAETQNKIFDPFFTTKFVGRGLGLPVVLGTVRAHGGTLAVESALGEGTTVRVLLPVAPISAPDARVPLAPARYDAKGPRLALVAEDEDALRRATKRILDRLGYLVVTVADGQEAVEWFLEHSDEVHLVILDLAMPRLDGWAALERIRARRPGVPVILASGYDEAHALEGRPAYPALVYLHKPYTLAEMRSAVERLSRTDATVS